MHIKVIILNWVHKNTSAEDKDDHISHWDNILHEEVKPHVEESDVGPMSSKLGSKIHM